MANRKVFLLVSALTIVLSVEDIQYAAPNKGNIQFTNILNASASISWTCNNKPYNVSVTIRDTDPCYNDCKPQILKLNTDKCQLELKPLCPNTLYDVRINGTGLAKPYWDNFKTAINAPDAAQNLKLTDVTSSSVSLSWTAPECPKNTTFTYEVTYTDAGKIITVPVKYPLLASIKDLNAETEYSFRVITCLEQDKKKLCSTSSPLVVKTRREKPGKPKNVIVRSKGADTIVVSWSSPNTTQSFNYSVNCSEASEGKYVDVGNIIEYDCKGLKPYTTYSATVRASFTDSDKKVIYGDPSDPKSTQTDPSAPGETKLASVTAISSTAITVTWKKPVPPNGPINGYTVLLKDGKTEKPYSAAGNELSKTVDELKPYKEYNFTVTAFNVVNGKEVYGKGETKTARTLMDKPSAPTTLKLTKKTSTDVSIQWGVPVNPNGVLSGYNVTYTQVERSPGDGPTELISKEIKPILTFTASDLIPYRNYSFAVKAFNVEGNKKYYGDVAAINIPTEIGVPNEPKDVKVIAESSGKLLVTWNRPIPMTGPTSYVVDLDVADPDSKTNCNDITKWNTTKSKSLPDWNTRFWDETMWAAKKCYQAKVTATTTKGSTASKLSAIMFTNETSEIPSSPKNVKPVAQSNEVILVTWDAPDFPTGATFGYKVRCTDTIQTGEFIIVDKPESRKFECKGLKSYVKYYVSVEATVKDKKTGEEITGTKSQSIETRTKAGKPGKASIIKLEAKESFSLDVWWDTPAELNGPIDYYSVNVTLKDKLVESQRVENTERYLRFENLTAYTEYQIAVAAVNMVDEKPLNGDIDSSTMLTLSDQPSPPVALKVNMLGTKTMTLECKPPVNKMGPINGYILRYIVDEVHEGDPEPKQYEKTISPPPADMKFNIDKLIPWRSYNLSLVAFNDIPTRRFESEAVSLQATTEIDVPGKAENVGVVPFETGLTFVHWDPPVPITGPTNYTVEFMYSDLDSKHQCKNESELQWNTTVISDNLDNWSVNFTEADPWVPNMCYKANVIAKTAAGKSESLSPVIQTNDKPKLPSRPRNVTVTSITNSSISITWEEPEELNNAKGYQVKCSLTPSTGKFVDADDSVNRKHTCKSLQIYDEYYIRVVAFILNGTDKVKGDLSTPMKAKTQPGEPGPVVIQGVQNITTKSAFVTWQVPKIRNGPIDYYTVSSTGGDTTVNENVSHPIVRINKLDPFVNYVVTVAAVNIVDKNTHLEGPTSETSFTSEGTNPGPVGNLKVSATSRAVTLNWDAPKKPNGPLNYYLISMDGKTDLNVTNTTVNIEKLSPDKDYSAHVTPVNVIDGDHLEGETVNATFKTLSEIPPYPKDNIKLGNAASTSVDFYIPNNLFSEENGRIINYALIVGSKENITKKASGDFSEDNVTTTYQDAKDTSPIQVYRSSPLTWIPTKGDAVNCDDDKDKKGKNCKLGAQTDCSKATYCNGPLRPNTDYGIKIRGYTTAGWSETEVAYTKTNGSPFLQPSTFLGLLMSYIVFRNY